jgi:hypothetical protein
LVLRGLSKGDAAPPLMRAQDELHSAAQARVWADGDFDADRGFGLSTEWAARPIRAGYAVQGWRRRCGCARKHARALATRRAQTKAGLCRGPQPRGLPHA